MELVKEFKNDEWNIYLGYHKDGKPYLEFNNNAAATTSQDNTFWIQTMYWAMGVMPDYAYNAMIRLGRKLLGCRYLYDKEA